ncbi:ABC transporter substrate-binding protein [Marinicrinis sediminis]|uniref:ABC transporter substrate-binding protein n=1 Tax=Marinicrinis sediminis TaxID=1652465 RepID=A0ABW5R933_9BACL
MMTKRSGILMLIAVLMLSLLAACGQGNNENGEATNTQSENQNEAAANGHNDEENTDSATDSNEKKEKQKVTVVLDWTPNTNHTGLYVAQANEYYEEAGLEVEIIQPGDAGAANLVAAGQADFGVSYQEEVTYARTGSELPIVSIAAVIQHNTSGFAAPVEKNIKSPKDFEGKTYGGWGSPVEEQVMDSLMRTEGADVSKVDFISLGDSDFFAATERDIDFAWIFYAWTGIEAELRGKSIDMIYLQDYAEELDYYTPVLITNENLIAEQPELVQSFMNATTEGYEFAMREPDKAAEILIEAEPELNAELVKASQEWLADQYQADAPRWGEQKESVWNNYTQWMLDNELLEKPMDISKAYTNDFLPAQGE